ncbi:MAG: hypothetical protein HZB51_13710 [Chloroflexi bacterium]|nr:hypothetical protein [Chloroflexota bacterium]
MSNNGHSPQIDYHLHGLVGIRLIDPSPSDVQAVTRQLGPIQSPLSSKPDITIRFVDRLSASSRVRFLGVDEAGFTDDAFLVLRSRHKARARVQIPMDRIGKDCEIICETGLPAVPLLIPIINLTALGKGGVPLHASAFIYNDKGVITTGWSRGGKTEMLLAFTSHGAEYIGDEWVYISPDGQRMHGIPEPIRVWDWHLEDLPQYRVYVSRGDRARWQAIKMLQAMDRMTSPRARQEFPPAKALNRLMPLLKSQLSADIHPERLFGNRFGSLTGNFDLLLFAASHDMPGTHVEPITPSQVARRMVFSLQYERLAFMGYYNMFRFAFPDRVNSLVERAEEIQRELLMQVMANKPAYAVYHPYPAVIPDLFDAVSPLIDSFSTTGEHGIRKV